MSDVAELNKMLNNPLFPIKDQNIANKLKALVESKKTTYKNAYPKIYEMAASRLRKELNVPDNVYEIIETDNIPEISSSTEDSGVIDGNYTYSYLFKDGIDVTIHCHRLSGGKYEYAFFLDRSSLKQVCYTNLHDAKCAAYFWKIYHELRKKGKQ